VSSAGSVNLLADQQEFDDLDDDDTADAEGAKLIIHLDQMETVDKTGQETIEEHMQHAEELLDKEVQEIAAINLHTPKMLQRYSYEEHHFEVLTAQAVQNQWNSREKEWKTQCAGMENKWNQRKTTGNRPATQGIARGPGKRNQDRKTRTE
jgi:hypothetical protein